MEKLNIVIVEDGRFESEMIKWVFENQTQIPCVVHTLAQWRLEGHDFEELCSDIQRLTEGKSILLLDHDLGPPAPRNGEGIAARFPNVPMISISSALRSYAKRQFRFKGALEERNKSGEKIFVHYSQMLIDIVKEVAGY